MSVFLISPEFSSERSGYNSEESKRKFQKFKNANRKNPVPAEARRWMKQAEADLKSAYNDLGAEEPAYEWVLLKSHQVLLTYTYTNPLKNRHFTPCELKFSIYGSFLTDIVM